jgi:YbbR domain-containing protein
MLKLLRNIFLRNWGLKLFSFILALLLWLTLIPDEKMYSEKTLVIPITLNNVPLQMELAEKVQPQINVTLIAPNRLLPQITEATVHAVLDLSNASIEQTAYPINKNMVSIPAGTEIRELYPSQVNIKLENAKEVLLKVEPTLIGEISDGLELKKVEASPSEVAIRGPESKVPDKAVVKTTPIDISKLKQSTEIEAELILPNPDVRLSGADTRVAVRFLIQEKTEEAEETEPDITIEI